MPKKIDQKDIIEVDANLEAAYKHSSQNTSKQSS